MPETPHSYALNFDAANELELQTQRARPLLERLAAFLAATEPRRSPELRDVVEEHHVRQAADFLFQLAAATEPPVTGPSGVFVSFSLGDNAVVDEIARKLDGVGVTHYRANRDLQPTSLLVSGILAAIRWCVVFVPVITPRFLQSDWCKFECGAACASGKPVLPVLRYVDPSDLPDPLRQFQAMTVESDEQMDKLIATLQGMCK